MRKPVLIRGSQDLAEQWQSLNRELTEALGTGREQLGDAARTAIRQRMATIDGQLAEAIAPASPGVSRVRWG